MTRLLAAAPAAVGLLAALVVLVVAPRTIVSVSASAALVVAVVGLLASLAVIGALAMRRRHLHARADAVRSTVEAERAATTAAHRRFLLRLDHELKNPLTALLAALAGAEPEPARVQAERIRALVADLRRMADIESAPLETVIVSVETVLQDAVDLVAGEGRDLRVDVPSAPWAPTVRADPDLLLVAVHNVLANAIKYSQPADVIELRARESGGASPTVTIEVADTGPGIADEDQAVVWEELARGHPAADIPGSGVGLALVRLILERHGGSADLSSRLGKGTAVSLHLPAVRPDDADR